MSNTTEQAVGIERYAERTPKAAEALEAMQEARANRREKDSHLVNPILQAVELVNAAASAVDGQWSPGEIARLRMVTNLVLEMGAEQNDERSRRTMMSVLPFTVGKDPRQAGRATLRLVASEMQDVNEERAEILRTAADLLTEAPHD